MDRRRETFDEVAKLYDEARPGYPSEAFDDLVTLARLSPGARVLEIGPGTGQASRPLLQRGLEITAVEPGAALGALLGVNCPEVDVIQARFEDYDPAEGAFDAVVCAQAWHWVPPEVGYAKASSALRQDGSLALMWNVHRGFEDGFFEAVQGSYLRTAPDVARDPTSQADKTGPEAHRQIEASGLFGGVETRVYTWRRTLDTETYLKLQQTHSDKRILPTGQLEALLADIGNLMETQFGGSITELHETYLYVAPKR